MMKMKLSAVFKKTGCAFMPYVCSGDPDIVTSEKIIGALVDGGADVIEFGLPFSDPIADGPTIQAATGRALDAGMNSEKYFKLCAQITKKYDVVLVCMTYYNLIFKYGLDRFARMCTKSGISALIVPDLPVEEAAYLEKSCRKHALDLIYLVAPTTVGVRLEKILKHSTGFIYLVSVTGVTGARTKMQGDVKDLLKKVKLKTKLPVCIGFGVSKPVHVRELKKMGFDGVIVGSAIVDVIGKNMKNKTRMLSELTKFAKSLSDARF